MCAVLLEWQIISVSTTVLTTTITCNISGIAGGANLLLDSLMKCKLQKKTLGYTFLAKVGRKNEGC